jgi:mitogen-activated protein kinase 1/3
MNWNFERFEDETQGAYEFQGFRGSGASASVFFAIRRSDNRPVAIRVIPATFASVRGAKQILREIRILRELSHPNIVQLIDIRTLPSYQEFSVLYIVLEQMETDLQTVISRNDLESGHRRFIIHQLCLALKYLHSANLLHRDIKPQNLLVNSMCDLKVCDFGLARVADTEGEMTEYVATRFYRAPELLLNYSAYDYSADMWSVGCVLVEMITKRPIAQGNDTREQIRLLVTQLGNPTPEDLQGCDVPAARAFVESLPQCEGRFFPEWPRESPEDEKDFVARLLCWNPAERMSADQALAHPYLMEINGDPDEAIERMPLDLFDFENVELSEEDLRALIWEEIVTFHPEYQEGA